MFSPSGDPTNIDSDCDLNIGIIFDEIHELQT